MRNSKNNVPLNKAEKQMVKNLDSVLSRLKDCTGTVMRVLELQSGDLEKFLKEYQNGKENEYDKYVLYWRKDNG